MPRSEEAHEPQAASITITSINRLLLDDSSDDNEMIVENQTDSIVEANLNNDDDSISDKNKLKSNVWDYAKKISASEAQCLKCRIKIKTNHGATSTLRKHLIMKHNLSNLNLKTTLRRQPKESISRERKIRLDHLADLAIFEDGRPFGDLMKSGMKKFLAEAVPGIHFYRNSSLITVLF